MVIKFEEKLKKENVRERLGNNSIMKSKLLEFNKV